MLYRVEISTSINNYWGDMRIRVVRKQNTVSFQTPGSDRKWQSGGWTLLPTTGSQTGKAWTLKQAPTLSYMSLTNTQPGYDQIFSYTWNGTNLNGSFSDSNILHALTKSSGDRSYEIDTQKYTMFRAQGGRNGHTCECKHHLHPSGTVDKTVNLSERHHTPPLLKEKGEAGRETKSARHCNVTIRKVEFIIWS